MAAPRKLKAVLGPVQLTFYAVGVIVGAGIYSVIGAAAGLAGDALWLSFIAGASVAALTGLSYAEMTTALPVAGAEYVYLRRAVPGSDWAPFGIGVILILGGAAASATVATAFGGYLSTFIDIPPSISAFCLLLAMTVLGIIGLREAGWANALFTSIEVLGLFAVILAGFYGGEMLAPLNTSLHLGILPAASLIFFVYLGFEEIANLAEETRNPPRDLPRAIIASIIITTVLYVLVALAVVTIVDPAELAQSPAPLALVMERAWPGTGGWLGAIALFATANTVLITLIASTRLTFSMGRDGELPPIFGRLSLDRQSPLVAAVAMFVLAIAFLPLSDIHILAELSSFAALLAFFAVNAALIILRYKAPDLERPFKVPGHVGKLPVLPVVAIVTIMVLLVNFDPAVYAAGAVALVAGAIAYILKRMFQR